jgi:hypothetical protein
MPPAHIPSLLPASSLLSEDTLDCSKVGSPADVALTQLHCVVLLCCHVPLALQTCVVAAINAFGATLPAVYQCALFTAAFGVALVMLSVFRPFEQRTPNLVGIQSLGCLILTAQAALVTAALTASSVADGASSSGTAAATAVCAVVIVVNVVFVLSFAWQLVRVVDWAAVGSATRKVSTKITSRCSGCVGSYSVGACLAGKSAES